MLWFFLMSIITICSILLSITGKSLGLRNFFAKVLLVVFEWASEIRATVDPSLLAEEIPNIGSGGAEYEEEKTERLKRRGSQKRRLLTDDRPLIDHYWSELINAKLHDPDYKPNIQEILKPDLPDSNKSSTSKRVIVREIVEYTLEFLSAGVEAIIEDKVTERFQAATLGNWNLLTRSRKFVPSNWKLDTVWLLGVIFRYTVLLPVRFFLFLIALFMLIGISILIGSIPNEEYRIIANQHAMLCFFRILSRAFSSIIKFHNTENRPKSGIVVANHTSPIDVMVLSCDNCYAMIGQRQGGFLGFIQKAVSRCAHHIWFERTETKDRTLVRKKLQEHVNDPTKLPVLIFPEGTCINNTSVMMFKKRIIRGMNPNENLCSNCRSKISDTVYPIAMKYDNRLGDAFWNSSQEGYFMHLVSMMTSWALMCEVYYLPPMTREEGEDPIDFASRVKKQIAQKGKLFAGGLVDLEWDGSLKRTMVPEKLKIKQKDQFYAYLARTMPITTETFREIRKISVGEADPEVLEEIENIIRHRTVSEVLTDGSQDD
ncbi:Phospholipid/glycerol acyltransferase domain-containing protein [Aphelenchoides besseyi]|nr:Phospholipid/glycerol acyltransferase domain-containing protein [Aphelenchoides besseyi]